MSVTAGTFLGFPLSKFFIPYVGGGLGVKLGGTDIDFAWKVDAGVASWLVGPLYVRAGAMYDNVRNNQTTRPQALLAWQVEQPEKRLD
jgi:hypothetical protein